LTPPNRKPPTVLFNASVILAGLASPSGGSAKLLKWAGEGRISGIISEIILDEVTRRAEKIDSDPREVESKTLRYFRSVYPAPDLELVAGFKKIVLDHGDAHLFATALAASVDFLVSLDKKHVLALKQKIKDFAVVSPKDLILHLS
jgi:predicted nucleic acid-binding protein